MRSSIFRRPELHLTAVPTQPRLKRLNGLRQQPDKARESPDHPTDTDRTTKSNRIMGPLKTQGASETDASEGCLRVPPGRSHWSPSGQGRPLPFSISFSDRP